MKIVKLGRIVQKRKLNFSIALFLVGSFCFSSVFAVDKRKLKNNTPQEVQSINIYNQLWSKAQSDEHLSFVQGIIDKHALNLNKKNRQGKTVLHIAVEGGAISIVEFLLSLKDPKRRRLSSGEYTTNNSYIDLSIQDKKHETVLQYALKKGHLEIIEKLIDAGVVLNQPIANGRNILHWAAIEVKHHRFTQPHLKFFIEKCKQANVSINAKDQDGNTPLMLAVMHENQAAAEALIKAGANLHTRTGNRKNVLQIAAIHIKDKAFFEFLVKRCKQEKLSVNERTYWHNTPLIVAVRNGNQVTAEVLIAAGARLLNPDNPLEDSVLHVAAANVQNKAFLEFLIEQFKQANLDINLMDEHKYTPLMRAVANNNQAAAEALIEADAKLQMLNPDNTLDDSVLRVAVAYLKNKAFLQFLINKFKQANLSIDRRDDNYFSSTPLMNAVRNKNQVAARALIKAGAQLQILNADNSLRDSVLHVAAVWFSNRAFLQFLIRKFKQANLDINALNADGETALMAAVRNGNEVAAEVLIEAEAQLQILNADNSLKDSILHVAAANLNNIRSNTFFQFLIQQWEKKHLDINAVDAYGNTPLMIVVRHRHQEATELLVKAGAQLQVLNPDNSLRDSVLHVAAHYVRRESFFQFLIEQWKKANLDINAVNDRGDTPLVIAATSNNGVAIRFLMKAGAKLQILNPDNSLKYSTLHAAANHFWTSEFFFQSLIIEPWEKAHLDINAVNAKGDTALMVAVEHREGTVVEALIKAGAKLQILNPDNSVKDTVLHFAAAKVSCDYFFQSFIKQCKQANLDINTVNADGHTPLMVAIQKENQVAAKALIEAGDKLQILNPDNSVKDTVLHFAAAKVQNKDFLQFLIEQCKQANLDINAVDENGYTPLMVAVWQENRVAAEALIEAKAQLQILNADNSLQTSILHTAALYVEDKGFLQFLIEQFKQASLDINAVDENGTTPLVVAVINTNESATKTLIEADAQLQILNADNSLQTGILHSAALYVEDKGFLQFLIEQFKQANLDINLIDKNGYTPLMVAAWKGNQTAAEALIEAQAQLSLRNTDNSLWDSILHISATHVKDNKDFFQFLIKKFGEKNIAIDEKNQAGQTPLMVAIENGNQAAAEVLIEAGAKLDIVDTKGYGLLHIAAAYVKDRTFLQFLIGKFKEKNLSIDAADRNGDVPLMIAAANGNQMAIEVLLEAEANLQDIINSYFH